MLAIPIIMAGAFIAHRLSAEGAVLGILSFVGLAVVALRRRSTIIFNLPGEPLIQASELLNGVAPQALRPSEALKMSVEDNIGDPRPAAEIFGYEPETFEAGVARILS